MQMISALVKIRPLINNTRMRYPYLIGTALWIGWLSSLLLGSGNVDVAGQLVGTDFVAFYTAGKILLMDRSSDLYDLELAHQIQQPLYNRPSENFYFFLNPPFYAWLFVPFALLPYPWSPILWMTANLGFLGLSVRLLGVEKPLPVILLVLTWQPAFAAISFGQNSFLSLMVLCLTYALWRKGNFFFAGLAAGMLLYKPHLLLGIGLLWFLEIRRNWRALAGLGASAVFLGGLSFALMPEATLKYITFIQKIASNLMTVEGFPIWNAHSVQAFWLALFPGAKVQAQWLYILCSAVGVWLFVNLIRTVREVNLVQFGAAICLTIWITPSIFIYDWVLLLIPAIIFWRETAEQRQFLTVIYAILWAALFVSSALTFVQWNTFGRAIQISIPILAFSLVTTRHAILTAFFNKQANAG